MLKLDPNRHAAVVFDCDGTLVDTMPLHYEAWCEAFLHHSAPFAFTWEKFVSRAGVTLEQTVVELNSEYGCRLDPQAVSARQREAYARRQDKIKTIDFVTDFAKRLRGSCPMAVASGSNRASVTHALSKVEILDWFDVVVTANDVTHGKPAPDVFLRAAELLGVRPAQCLVVEDGAPGVEAARRAGMDAYLVTREGECTFIASPSTTIAAARPGTSS
jgi:beta-phosphoglucomutase family hydrolase